MGTFKRKSRVLNKRSHFLNRSRIWIADIPNDDYKKDILDFQMQKKKEKGQRLRMSREHRKMDMEIKKDLEGGNTFHQKGSSKLDTRESPQKMHVQRKWAIRSKG